MERQNQCKNGAGDKITTNNATNQKYTYLDPAKTKRVPNITLKAFQKNAVQSYFERQQQQQNRISPGKDNNNTTFSINQFNTKQMRNQNTIGDCDIVNNKELNSNETLNNGNSDNNSNLNSSIMNVSMRPQSLPVNKIHSSMETISQSRLSLPNKLSQIINLTTHLSAQRQSMNGTPLLKQSDKRNSISMSSPIKMTANVMNGSAIQTTVNGNRVMSIEQSNLKSINESGVPPPPPRRTNQLRASVPVRR